MKKHFKLFLFLGLFILMFFALYGCMAADSGGKGEYIGSTGDSLGGVIGDSTESDSEGDGGDADTNDDAIFEITQEDIDEINKIQAGQITSMEWSDCEHYEDWLKLLKLDEQGTEKNGKLAVVYKNLLDISNNLIATNMYIFKITSGENVLRNAKVKVLDTDQNVIFESVTDVNGITYIHLKEFTSTIIVSIEYNKQIYSNTIELNVNERFYNINISDVEPLDKPKTLDLLLVIDTTGSMYDEIAYLQAELKDVLSNLSDLNMDIRLSLLFYRDHGDEYVTLKYDFTTNIDSQILNLSKQNADGGGDWEEAVDIAYDEVTKLSWGEDSVKIMFHVADAPPHFHKYNIGLFAQSIRTLAQKGVRIIPIACSGIEITTEALYRIAALYTGGTYTYLTDHSGIGNDHHESVTGATVVELLNKMMIRLIKEYCTGEDIEPVSYLKEYIAELTFDSVGGSYVNSIFLMKGNTVTALQKPNKENHTFLGWYYLDGEVEIPFTLETVVNKDLTLYAKWQENTSEKGSN